MISVVGQNFISTFFLLTTLCHFSSKVRSRMREIHAIVLFDLPLLKSKFFYLLSAHFSSSSASPLPRSIFDVLSFVIWRVSLRYWDATFSNSLSVAILLPNFSLILWRYFSGNSQSSSNENNVRRRMSDANVILSRVVNMLILQACCRNE